MPPVFAHGRLRLYLLKLLDEAPRHGYEVIRLLEERFHGLYAPSAGTVYPRLAKLQSEGLVTHTTEGGRKVYAITDAGRAELADRSGELADLELEIRDSVAELAAEIRDDVRGAAGDLRREVRAATSQARGARPGQGPDLGDLRDLKDLKDLKDLTDNDSWRTAKEELRRAKQEWKEQARRAKDESRRAREEAQRARRQAKETQDEWQRMAQRVQDRVQDHFARGDWPTGVREGLSELAKEFGDFGKTFGKDAGPGPAKEAPGPAEPVYRPASDAVPAEYVPAWAAEDSTGDPARDLDRLLDRFRDDIRDTARDHGVSADQLHRVRHHLAEAAGEITASLRTPRK
ncbi:helix-turn-helix transcriptional regulator [Streptomyces sp. NPDC049813]|uniref:PadR family transcriptional regulator n=1 Tax=Streptomyces sp. NPDC049813 TaxID=3365597 RepID=UPI0037BBD088